MPKDENKAAPSGDGLEESFEARTERGRSTEGDAGRAEVQKRTDEAEEKGYVGLVPDPTPNENYSLETGQDAPTPETDADLYDKARDVSLGHPLKDIDNTAVHRVKGGGS